MTGSRVMFISALLLSAAFISSCGPDDGRNATIKTVINGNPATLDPQTSLADSSVGIIANVFTGLFAYDEGSRIVPAMADEYTVSDDGLVWDFRLREDVMWYDGEDFSAPCTAYDYVFAFRRLINPATQSRRAAEYYCIKNAESLNKGVIYDMTMLGVEAIDEYRLRITLDEPCFDFRAKLAAAPAMPCSEEFFNKTEGMYGLSEDCLASNGSFCLYSWRYDKWSSEGNYIILRRNKLNNTEENVISPYGVTFFIDTDGVKALKDKEINCLASGSANNMLNDFPHKEYDAGSCGLIFNCSGVFNNVSLRTALGVSACRHIRESGAVYSDALIPDTAVIGELNYRSEAGRVTTEENSFFDISDRFIEAVAEVGADEISGLKLIIPKNSGLRDYLGPVLQGWQKDHGFFCSLVECDSAEYRSALENGNFDIAAVDLRGDSAAAFLDSFVSGSSKNYYGIENKKLDHILKSVYTAPDPDKAAMYLKEAEQTVLDMFYFVPVYFGTDSIYYADGVSGVRYVPHIRTFLFKDAVKIK